MRKRLIQNSTFGGIANLATTITGFVSGLLVARLLGVDGTGVVAFAIWLATTGVTLASGGISFTLGRYLPELTTRGAEAEARNLGAYLLGPYFLLVSLPVLGLAGYGVWLLAMRHGATPGGSTGALNDPFIWFLASACCLSQAFGEYARGFLRGMQRFDRIAHVTIVACLAQPVIILVAGYVLGIVGALLGYLVANIIFGTLIFSVNRRGGAISPELRGRVIRYAAFRWAAEILTAFVWSRLEVFFLQISWGSNSIGLFTVALTVANLAIQGPIMLTWGLIPHFAERIERKEFDRVGEDLATGTRLMAFFLLPSCVGLSAIMPVFLPMLYGSAFEGAVYPAIILVCSAGIATISTVAWNVIWAMERTDVDFYIGGVGAVVALIGGLVIIPHFGPIGAAWSRSAAQLVIFLISSWFVARRLKFALPLGDLVRLLLAALICGFAAEICLVLVPGAKGLPLAILAGTATYFVAVRYLKALPDSDIDKFRSLFGLLPPPLSVAGYRMLNLLAGESRSSPATERGRRKGSS